MSENRGQFDQALVDRLVREVVARLQAAPQPSTATNQPAASELRIDQQVITVRDVEASLAGIQILIVPAGAIVTPAVKDLLREAGVQLTYQTRTTSTHNTKTTTPLVLATCNTRFDAANLARWITTQDVAVERLAQTDLKTIVQEMTREVALGGKLGLLLTDAAPLALCLANRQPGIRAAQAKDLNEVRRANQLLATNLLIIEPRGQSTYHLQRMAAEHTTGWPRQTPTELN